MYRGNADDTVGIVADQVGLDQVGRDAGRLLARQPAAAKIAWTKSLQRIGMDFHGKLQGERAGDACCCSPTGAHASPVAYSLTNFCKE